MTNKSCVIEMFNRGCFSIIIAERMHKEGYAFICNDGVLIDIVRED